MSLLSYTSFYIFTADNPECFDVLKRISVYKHPLLCLLVFIMQVMQTLNSVLTK